MSTINLGQKAYSAETFMKGDGDANLITLVPVEGGGRKTSKGYDNEFVLSGSEQYAKFKPNFTYYFKYDLNFKVDGVDYFESGDTYTIKLTDKENFQSVGKIIYPTGYIVFTPKQEFDSIWIQYKGGKSEHNVAPTDKFSIEMISMEEFKASHIGVRGRNGDVVVINGESIEIGRRDIFEIEMDVTSFAVTNMIDHEHNILVDYIVYSDNSEEED